jgi:hypothetical protein
MATLPNPNRNWTKRAVLGATVAATGVPNNTNRDLLVALPAAMITHGLATRDYSCNGSVAGAKGDGVEHWNARADIVGNTPGNAHSWRVDTLAGGLGQMLIDRDNTLDGSGSVFWSESVGFTGGTTTARPTASDEREITVNTNILSTTDGTHTLYLWRCSDSGTESIRLAVLNSGVAAGPVALVSIEKAASTPAAWGTKIEASWNGGAGNFGNRSDWTVGGWQARVAGTARNPVATGDTPPTTQDADGDWIVVPCELTDGTIGALGFADDFHFVADTFPNLKTFSDAAGIRGWIAFDEVVWPWDHATDLGAGNQAGAKLRVNYSNTVDSLLISATPTPGALGATFDAAKWTPVVIVFTVPPAPFQPAAWAQIGADGLEFIAYKGAQGFSPLFAQHSSIQVVGSTVTLTLLPIGGWWAAPIVTPGLFLEAH